MLRLSLQTLRAHRRTLTGAFVAIWLAVTLGYGAGLLMTAAISAPGPGRFAAADFVVRANPSVPTVDGESEDAIPGPRVGASLVGRFPGAVGDISFPVGNDVYAHGWASAALTPYRLTSGREPKGTHEVVLDDRLPAKPEMRITTPGGEANYRVVGRVHGAAGPPTMFFADRVADRLSGAPGQVNAIVIRGPRPQVSGTLQVLDRAHAANADASDPRAADRVTLIAIFGVMAGVAGTVALFVVAGTFTLAIVQRRRELAVIRALGAAPHQVRRLVAGEALIVSIVAGALGILAGRPLAYAIVSVLADHDVVPPGFAPGHSWIPLVAALGGGLAIAQLSVFAAARRAGKTRPAEALREAAIEHPRPSIIQLLIGLACLGGGVAMAVIFKGQWAVAFAILEGMLLAFGVGMLSRLLLGFPAALLARPLRAFGASGLLASTSLAANRWRTAALATPIVLVTMLAGTQGIVQSSGQHQTESVTAARVTAPFVITGRDGGPIPADTRIHAHGLAAVASTEVFPDGDKLAADAPWPAAGITSRGAPTLDLKVLEGRLGDGVAISRVFAQTGRLHVGDTFGARMADLSHRTLRVGAIYERAAGLGDVILDHTPAPTTAIFVTGSRPHVPEHGLQVLTRDEYRRGLHSSVEEASWGVWMIVGLAALFATLALINTAAMSTAERRGELATIRMLGGTPGQAARMMLLETLPTVAIALVAGAAVVAVSVHGVPLGLTGIPLAIPATLIAGVVGGSAALGGLAALVGIRAV